MKNRFIPHANEAAGGNVFQLCLSFNGALIRLISMMHWTSTYGTPKRVQTYWTSSRMPTVVASGRGICWPLSLSRRGGGVSVPSPCGQNDTWFWRQNANIGNFVYHRKTHTPHVRAGRVFHRNLTWPIELLCTQILRFIPHTDGSGLHTKPG